MPDLLKSQELIERFARSRAFSLQIVENLSAEDCNLQAMEDASPMKWHLAHTTWFYERFVLRKFDPQYKAIDEQYDHLFNSYYVQVGLPHMRHRRSWLSRPSLGQVRKWRQHMDQQILGLLQNLESGSPDVLQRIELGIQHEQQHHELMLSDIKYNLFAQPFHPTFRELRSDTKLNHFAEGEMIDVPGGIYEIGSSAETFTFDNEGPRHRVLIDDFAIAKYPVTNQQFIAFVEDGGYQRPELWLSLGWNWVQENQLKQPLYWLREANEYKEYTLNGIQTLVPHAPVCHLSYFEAEALARWAEARLPTEQEWEVSSQLFAGPKGTLLDDAYLHPQPLADNERNQATLNQWCDQMIGGVWEWTQSAYSAYPGFKSYEGDISEYNGKFMCQQQVLRGGSCWTWRDHIRSSYRNFMPPNARWQMSGLRLAR